MKDYLHVNQRLVSHDTDRYSGTYSKERLEHGNQSVCRSIGHEDHAGAVLRMILAFNMAANAAHLITAVVMEKKKNGGRIRTSVLRMVDSWHV